MFYKWVQSMFYKWVQSMFYKWVQSMFYKWVQSMFYKWVQSMFYKWVQSMFYKWVQSRFYKMSPVHVLQMSPVQVLQVQSSPCFTTCLQILCTSHFKFVWKYAPPWIRNTWISEFFLLFYIISTQTIYVNQKLHTLSRFATLRVISIFLIHPVYCKFVYVS